MLELHNIWFILEKLVVKGKWGQIVDKCARISITLMQNGYQKLQSTTTICGEHVVALYWGFDIIFLCYFFLCYGKESRTPQLHLWGTLVAPVEI
jgi:hypothetical protein